MGDIDSALAQRHGINQQIQMPFAIMQRTDDSPPPMLGQRAELVDLLFPSPKRG